MENFVSLDILGTYNTVHLNDYTYLMPSGLGIFRIGSEWFLKFGSDSGWIISERIRILKFTNYRIGNFQSDPMHTSIPDLQFKFILQNIDRQANLRCFKI